MEPQGEPPGRNPEPRGGNPLLDLRAESPCSGASGLGCGHRLRPDRTLSHSEITATVCQGARLPRPGRGGEAGSRLALALGPEHSARAISTLPAASRGGWSPGAGPVSPRPLSGRHHGATARARKAAERDEEGRCAETGRSRAGGQPGGRRGLGSRRRLAHWTGLGLPSSVG